jgi:hypothetical protein
MAVSAVGGVARKVAPNICLAEFLVGAPASKIKMQPQKISGGMTLPIPKGIISSHDRRRTLY